MKIAIIGAKGLLGRELARVLGPKHEVSAWDIEEIDTSQGACTLIGNNGPVWMAFAEISSLI